MSDCGPHPFRFAVSAPTGVTSVREWTEQIRRIEAMGFDAAVVADHFTGGYDLEPMVALTAAAGVTSTLRLQTGVLGNDYRHPVLVARMAAALDALSGGRFVLGMGAGWMASDYTAAGIALDPPGVRVDRFTEAVTIVKGLLRGGPYSFTGTHYRIDALTIAPTPVQRPHPPLFLGGGSPRVLRLAGREAQIVGINASLAAGELGAHAVLDLRADRVAEKIGWVREGVHAAGRSLDGIELEMNHWLVRITPTVAEGEEFLAKIAARYEIAPEVLAHSPSVLVGTVEQCADTLVERREQLGFSYLQLDAGFAPKDLDSLAPLVARLAGT
jgi:probable F420-dependent oxidoreductase